MALFSKVAHVAACHVRRLATCIRTLVARRADARDGPHGTPPTTRGTPPTTRERHRPTSTTMAYGFDAEPHIRTRPTRATRAPATFVPDGPTDGSANHQPATAPAARHSRPRCIAPDPPPCTAAFACAAPVRADPSSSILEPNPADFRDTRDTLHRNSVSLHAARGAPLDPHTATTHGRLAHPCLRALLPPRARSGAQRGGGCALLAPPWLPTRGPTAPARCCSCPRKLKL